MMRSNHKMIQNKLLGIAAAVVLVLGMSTAANAGTVTYTSGGNATITITGPLGQAFTVDIFVSAASGTSFGYEFASSWDGGATPILTQTGFTELTVLDFILVPGVVIAQSAANVAGDADGWDNGCSVFPFSCPDPLSGALVGTLSFTTSGFGTTTVSALFKTGDAILDSGGGVDCGVTPSNPACTINAFTINVIPEPATASLLGLGIAGLAIAGRRRRR